MPNRHAADRDLRREAIQIAAQLPPNRKDALRVLALARVLVVDFLEQQTDCSATGIVTRLARPRPSE